MKYQVDGWNNFCRIFELPDQYPEKYCFSGGHPVTMVMVDWFNPVPEVPIAAVTKEVWEKEVGEIVPFELDHDNFCNAILPFLQGKQYIKEEHNYLLLCNFGLSLAFQKKTQTKEDNGNERTSRNN